VYIVLFFGKGFKVFIIGEDIKRQLVPRENSEGLDVFIKNLDSDFQATCSEK
jgi:hypothetical protein